MTEIKWKVFRCYGDQLTNLLSGGPLANVRYAIGQPTAAPIGGLFVFRSQEHADAFADYMAQIFTSIVVAECQCEDQIPLPKMCLKMPPSDIELVSKLWAGDSLPSRLLVPVPRGSEAFRVVTPIRIVRKLERMFA